MAVYRDQLLPRFQDRVMDRKATREVRARICNGLSGEVVEVGFGTGLNAAYYPKEVTKVLAVEPSTVCMRLAEPRIAKVSAPVELAGLNGERLDLPTEEFGAVLSTWTLSPTLPARCESGLPEDVTSPATFPRSSSKLASLSNSSIPITSKEKRSRSPTPSRVSLRKYMNRAAQRPTMVEGHLVAVVKPALAGRSDGSPSPWKWNRDVSFQSKR